MADLWDALNYAGSSLDKLGPRPLRGLLAGRPRELGSIVPFSDTLGLTDPADIATGRHLTDKWGWTTPGADDPMSHALGMATEVALDPLMLGGAALGGVKALHGLSSMMKPSTMNPVHHLAGLLGDVGAAGRLKDLSPIEALKWSAENRRGALRLIKPADYVSMARDEGNPLGRLHALAGATGRRVYPAADLSDASAELAKRAKLFGDETDAFHSLVTSALRSPGRQPYAVFSPTIGEAGAIVPNVVGHPHLWSDLGEMEDIAAYTHGRGHHAAGYGESTAVHEIGHAEHYPTNDYSLEHGPLGYGIGHWHQVDPTPKMSQIRQHVSDYATTNPLEFVAEAFSKAAERGGQFDWLPENLRDLYLNYLSGPEVPDALLKKLHEYHPSGLVLPSRSPGGLQLPPSSFLPLQPEEAARLAASADNPLGRFAAMAGHTPAEFRLVPDLPARPSLGDAYATYTPGYEPSSMHHAAEAIPPEMSANLNWGIWRGDEAMRAHLRALEQQGLHQASLRPDAIGVHEAAHAFHYGDLGLGKELPGSPGVRAADIFGPEDITGYWEPGAREQAQVRKVLGPYALTNADEFVAEALTHQLLGGHNLPPALQRTYDRFMGPDPNKLPAAFLEAIRNSPMLLALLAGAGAGAYASAGPSEA